MTTNEMAVKVRELKELKTLADELAAEITAIEDDIKAEMTARGAEEMTVDVFTVRWKHVTSARFDSAGLKKAMPELYDRFTKTSVTRRFCVV